MRPLFISALVCLPAISGRTEGDEGPKLPWRAQAVGAEGRNVMVADWDTLWSVGGSLEDSLLLYPGQVESSDSMLAVLDFSSNRITAIDLDGRHLWTFGGSGRGPSELKSARDLAFRSARKLAVLDPGNGKIVELDRDGRLERTFSTGTLAIMRRPIGFRIGPLVSLFLEFASTSCRAILIPCYKHCDPATLAEEARADGSSPESCVTCPSLVEGAPVQAARSRSSVSRFFFHSQ